MILLRVKGFLNFYRKTVIGEMHSVRQCGVDIGMSP